MDRRKLQESELNLSSWNSVPNIPLTTDSLPLELPGCTQAEQVNPSRSLTLDKHLIFGLLFEAGY